MKIENLEIWGRNPPAAWVRDAANRWGALMKRAALLFVDLMSLSPLPRSETEILFFLLLSEGEKSEPAILAEKLHVSRQTMTGLLDKLEASELVARTDHPTDRRRKVVRLTPAGFSLARDVASRILRRDAALIATFDREKTVETLDLMEGLCDKVEKWNREHPFRGEARPPLKSEPGGTAGGRRLKAGIGNRRAKTQPDGTK